MTVAQLNQRKKKQMQAMAMINALVDEVELYVSHAQIMVNQTGNVGSYFNYIELDMGNLPQARYDLLREVVNGLGGDVLIQGAYSKDGEGNVRIWLGGE